MTVANFFLVQCNEMADSIKTETSSQPTGTLANWTISKEVEYIHGDFSKQFTEFTQRNTSKKKF